MKALTIWQPWASLIAAGLKRYETRSWATDYRGLLAIHAAKRPLNPDEIRSICYGLNSFDLEEVAKVEHEIDNCCQFGAILAIAELKDCLPTASFIPGPNKNSLGIERILGNYQPGRFAWKLQNIQPLIPIPTKGQQGLWIPSSELIAQINSAVKL